MWIFLNDAFLSIVADRNDPDNLLVRARFPADIERIFPDAEVIETPNADYRFRASLRRNQVSRIVGDKVLALAATNFKASVIDRWRHSVYFDVWKCMTDAQRRLHARERRCCL
ncbi:MAG: hypothetical protein ACM3Q0_01140 [Bacteroidota bacterium]